MEDKKIRKVGQQIIEKYGSALRKMAECDQYGQPEEELIDDNSDDDGDEEQFRKFIQWQMEKEASAIEAELQVTMEVDPELRNLKVPSELDAKVDVAIAEFESKRSK